jgi:hypothetical protein
MPWIEPLPTVLLGHRTCIKEDMKASAAELLYGMPLGIPGEFFANDNMPVDCKISWKKFANTCENYDQHHWLITSNRVCSSSRTSTRAPTSS